MTEAVITSGGYFPSLTPSSITILRQCYQQPLEAGDFFFFFFSLDFYLGLPFLFSSVFTTNKGDRPTRRTVKFICVTGNRTDAKLKETNEDY